MPSGTAHRPGDVVTMRGGKTVEIINTDAEGRMVLADAIVLAGEDAPDAIVDIATLTGAQVVALGTRTAGVMANDDGSATRCVAAGGRSRRGDVADAAAGGAARGPGLPRRRPRKHTGERHGGMLDRRASSCASSCPRALPWAHLDIAGPSYNDGRRLRLHPQGRHRLRRPHAGRGWPRPTPAEVGRRATVVGGAPGLACRYDGGPDLLLERVGAGRAPGAGQPLLRRNICGPPSAPCAPWIRLPLPSPETSRPPCALLLVQRLAEPALHVVARALLPSRVRLRALGLCPCVDVACVLALRGHGNLLWSLRHTLACARPGHQRVWRTSHLAQRRRWREFHSRIREG